MERVRLRFLHTTVTNRAQRVVDDPHVCTRWCPLPAQGWSSVNAGHGAAASKPATGCAFVAELDMVRFHGVFSP